MNTEILQNFTEKLRLVNQEILDMLESDIQQMLREHSRDGKIGSGATIQKTMNFISSCNSNLYHEVLSYLNTLNIRYKPTLEIEILNLANESQEKFKQAALMKLQKSTEIARAPNLYERMLPDVESSMANDLAIFQNRLNSFIIDLKLNNKTPALVKALWVLEIILLASSIFIAGMWYKYPQGNYEPLFAGLGLIIPLILVVIKFARKKT